MTAPHTPCYARRALLIWTLCEYSTAQNIPRNCATVSSSYVLTLWRAGGTENWRLARAPIASGAKMKILILYLSKVNNNGYEIQLQQYRDAYDDSRQRDVDDMEANSENNLISNSQTMEPVRTVTLSHIKRETKQKKDGTGSYGAISILVNTEWLSGFQDANNATWNTGDSVQILVETKGKYKNFKALDVGKVAEAPRQAPPPTIADAPPAPQEVKYFPQETRRYPMDDTQKRITMGMCLNVASRTVPLNLSPEEIATILVKRAQAIYAEYTKINFNLL